MKVLNRVQREYEQAVSNTLPRNAFSALEQEKLASLLQQQTTNVSSSSSRSNTLGDRSKTLGPGFMRGHHHGYMPDPGASQDNEVMIPSRFSAMPEGGRYYSRPESTEEAKARMMHMEAQLSQLTGMVEKALKNKKMGKKTVSFDKSVTYSDDPQPHPQGILVTNKSKSNGHDRGGNSGNNSNHVMVSKSHSDNDLHVNLKRLHRSARELKQEVRVLRRLTQLQSMAMKDLVQDTYIKLREACISFSTNNTVVTPVDPELYKLVHNEDNFVQELNELVTSICQLEAKVEETRSGVINKKNKISLDSVENMAFTLSKCSKTVTLLKQAFPTLEANIKSKVGEQSSEKRRMTEDFLKRTPDRMENIWRRCKKLTGTLVTLKRLASVQEQRFHPGAAIEMSLSPTPTELVVAKVSNNNNHHSNNHPPPPQQQQQQQQNGVIEASPHKRKTSRPSSAEVKEVIQGNIFLLSLYYTRTLAMPHT